MVNIVVFIPLETRECREQLAVLEERARAHCPWNLDKDYVFAVDGACTMAPLLWQPLFRVLSARSRSATNEACLRAKMRHADWESLEHKQRQLSAPSVVAHFPDNSSILCDVTVKFYSVHAST